METKESVLFMKKRKVVDRTDALAALEDLEKKMNQLKKRKTELLAIAGLASTDKIPTTNGMITATPKVSNVNNSIRSVTKGAVGANNNSNSIRDEHITTFVSETILPTKQGKFRIRAYRCETLGMEPLAIMHENVRGDFANASEAITLRVHDKCMTSEVLGSLKCDCKEQLFTSMSYVQNNGGMVIYLQQEGRGIGIANKIAAYNLQEHGADTVEANTRLGLPAEARRYEPVKFILDDLKVKHVSLMTNNPFKISSLEKLGIRVTSRKSIIIEPNMYSSKYLKCKRERMGHYDLISNYMVVSDGDGKA